MNFNEDVYYFSAQFFNSSLFEQNFPITFGSINHNTNFKFTSIKNYLKLLNDDRNHPQGHESDKCLNEIFKESCRWSQNCLEIEDPEKKSFGYQLTHK